MDIMSIILLVGLACFMDAGLGDFIETIVDICL